MKVHVGGLFVLIFTAIFVYGRCSLVVKRFENCESNANYSANYNLTFKTIGKSQYLDGTIIFRGPLDNSLRVNISVNILTGKDYVYLFSINERKAYDAAHKYLGEFLYDIERYGQLISGMCPIQKGTYHWHNVPLDYSKITTLANFLFGNLRFIVVIYKANNAVYGCIVLEVEHHMM